MIKLDHVAMQYGDRPLFGDVNLSLPQGSFHFLTGPSGSGKTSLIALCALERQPSGGVVRVLDTESTALDRDEIARLRQRIGVVHQDSRFIDHLPLRDNVLLPVTVTGEHSLLAEKHLAELLDWVGLEEVADRLPPELSGGERQRAALARAVILSPDVVLADEPTGNVDWEMSLRLLDLLIELNRLGKTVLCATHDLNLIRQAKQKVPARVLRLRDGGVALAGTEI